MGNGVAVGSSAPQVCSVGAGDAMSIDSGKTFELGSVAGSGRHTLVLKGEIDLLAAPALEAAVRELCAAGTAEIVLDLRDVTFMDSTGMRATVAAHQLCLHQGCAFSVIPGPPEIQTLFELTGLADSVPFQADGERPGAQETLLHKIFSGPSSDG